ncbi:hypothetical protein AVEN_33902-1 [Araneus ventricosus]|uniref:Uncharacterized protein n=1 Tax=Araneus ventricosus TaxID=182803 RepID=A0A4Y2EJM3_ARAVE|nr:hypothetical protein AVEN_33902-1 [Araneus ventricosus]
MSMFESDILIVLTSMPEEGESLIRQDRGCRPGDTVSSIPGNECVLFLSLAAWDLVLSCKNKTPKLWSGHTAQSDFNLFPTLKSTLSGPHF